MTIKLIPLLIFFLTFAPTHLNAETLTGKVVGISDGDTITILDAFKKQHKIRLYGIDCPESGQPYGKAAKKHTAKLTARKQAEVRVYDTDRYGRTVGVVTVNGVNVNLSLIEHGYAWQYRKYCKSSFCSDWLNDEKRAMVSGVGLWGDKDPIPPWAWRKGARNSSYKVSRAKYKPVGNVYHGNVKSHKFHSSNCRHYNCTNCKRNFSSREEAYAAGYKPCGMCKP